jgi:DNA-binding CsgD family transcriptional regulator/PAS domain-containing protein
MDAFMQLVELGYEAVADFSRWPEFLASYNRTIEADRCGLYVRVQDAQSLQMFEATPSDAYWAAQLASHYSRISPLTAIVQPKASGWAGVLKFPKSYFRSEFYDGYMAPQDLEHAVAGIMAKWSDSHRVTLMGFRGKRRRPFAAATGTLQARLMQQLRWAFMLRQRLLQAQGDGPRAWEAWELCPQAVLMLNRRRAVVYANPAARRLLEGPCGLQMRGKRLLARRAEDDPPLQRLVRDALQLGQWSRQAGGTLQLREPGGAPGLSVNVHPLNVSRETLALGDAQLAVVVFLFPPPAPPPLSGESLRLRFALTPAESRLALALTQGEGLRRVSETLGISYGTARSQLLAIFGKTGAHRQTALLRLLLGGAAEPLAQQDGQGQARV